MPVLRWRPSKGPRNPISFYQLHVWRFYSQVKRSGEKGCNGRLNLTSQRRFGDARKIRLRPPATGCSRVTDAPPP
eukprot:1673502-Prymnesium_polylepis.1